MQHNTDTMPLHTQGSAFSNRLKGKIQIIIFSLGDETFGVEIDGVSMVKIFDKVFRVPNVPSYVLGVTKYQEKIITVYNLKNRLNIENVDPKKGDYKIIVLDVFGTKVGMLVDKVEGLITIPVDNIQDALVLINSNINQEYIKGVTTQKNQIIVLLNVETIFSYLNTEEILEVSKNTKNNINL